MQIIVIILVDINLFLLYLHSVEIILLLNLTSNTYEKIVITEEYANNVPFSNWTFSLFRTILECEC